MLLMDKEAQLHKQSMSLQQKICELQNRLEESMAQSALKKNSSAELLNSRRKVDQLEEALQAEKKKVKVRH